MSHNRWLLAVLLVFILSISTVATTVSAAPSYGTKTGVSIEIGPSDKDRFMSEAQAASDQFGLEVPEHVFLFFEEDGTPWAVLSDTEPSEGTATVEGTIVPTEDTETSVGLIFADSVDIEPEGEPVSLNAYLENPGEYGYQNIELVGHLRQIALMQEVAEGSFRSRNTRGMIAETFPNDPILRQPSRAARVAAINVSSTELGGPNEIARKMEFGRDGGIVWDLDDRQFWVDARVRVDAVAINQSGFHTLHPAKIEVLEDRTTSVKQLATNDSATDDVVALEANAIGSTIGVKEVLIEMAPCGPDAVVVPVTPPGCVPITTDATIHVGFLVGESTDQVDIVAFAAISNTEQTEIIRPQTGRYRVTGRVVSTSQISPMLPDGNALIVYEMERQGDFGLSQDARQNLRDRSDELARSMMTQMNMTADEYAKQNQSNRSTPTETATPTATVKPTSTSTNSPEPTPSPTESESEGTATTPPTTSSPGQPGFGIVAAIFALLTVFMIGRIMSNLDESEP